MHDTGQGWGRGPSRLLHRPLVAVGLRFEDAADERRFVQRFILDDIGRTQAAMMLGAAIYAGFAIWDRFIDPVHWPAAVAVRLAVAGLVLLPLTALLLNRRARIHAEAIFLVYCLVPGCILPVIYSLLDGGFEHAAAGVIIVILFVSTLLPLRVPTLAIFCALTWLSFVLLESYADLREGMRVTNNFEIGISYALSLYATTAREYRARREFRTGQELHREKERSDATLAELRRAQAHLIQAEKHAALRQLVAGIAHEVNTPVGLALTVATALAADARRLDGVVATGQVRRSELAEGLKRIDEGAGLVSANLTRAADLIHTFKQVASDQASEERRRFEVASWMRSLLVTLEPVLRRRGLTTHLDCPEGLHLDSHPGALAQVISTLALNAAVHAYPEAGAGVLRLTASDRATHLSIEVADEGVGILPEHLSRVFDPFFTTARERGSLGLGLHVVFNLVASTLRGHIAIESGTAAGTRCRIELPWTLDAAREAQAVPAVPSGVPA